MLNRLTPQSVFLIVAGFFGIVCGIVNPPIQVPDEAIHWYRVYQLSQGKIVARRFGGDIPSSLVNIGQHFNEALAFRPWTRTTPKQITDWLRVPLNPRANQPQWFPATAVYSIVPYAPQTLTTFIARKLKWPALWVFYAGRLGALLGYLLIGYSAIRMLPILKWPACMILTNPMCMMLSASLSADPVTIALAFLAIALVLRCTLSSPMPSNQLQSSQMPSSHAPPSQPLSTRPISRFDVIILVLVMVAVALCKSVYFPLALLVLAIPRQRWTNWKTRWGSIAAIVLLPVLAVAIWSAVTDTAHVNDPPVPLHDNLHWVLTHPLGYLKIFRLSLAYFAPQLLQSSVGMLGYYETPLPTGVIAFFLISLTWIALVYDEPIALPAFPRWIALMVYLCSCFLVITSVYIVWNPFNQKTGTPNYMIEALQGRYFLPVSLLIFVVIRRRGRYPIQPAWMLLLLSCISLYTTYALIERYYLPADWFYRTISGS